MLELNKLYNMDCMQGMKEFPDGFFDLAIVDPPYGIGIDGQKKRVCGNPKHKESNVKHDATVLTEIGYIKANTDEIKAEQKEQRKTNTEFVTRLTDVEASAKQAHKRLDHIEKRMDQAE